MFFLGSPVLPKMSPRPILASLTNALLTACALVLTCPGPVRAEGSAIARALALPKASLLVEEAGKPVIAHQADRPMVPASTMKVLTALAAIKRWGLDHRFETRLLRDGEGRLWVQGAGDPYLVSEELDLMARAVRAAGVTSVAGVGADDSLFAPTLDIPGRSASDNPYDAPVTALAANFNTLNLKVTGGTVASAEPQTPLTPLARRLGQAMANGTQRVNLKDKGLGARYFAEVLSAKLEAAGVKVTAEPRVGRVPAGARPLLTHANSRDLRAMLVSMLEYSNNFVANGLFLKLADRGDGGPITIARAQQAMAKWIDRELRWGDYRVEDGAGLSRCNRLSARQLGDVLDAFAPYRNLLPRQGDSILAKTGTLTGVSTYAGYVNRDGRWTPFSLLINQPVDGGLRKQVAADLARAPNLRALCSGASC
jgi:D-alanyl-D-alanine carboxypeptidase/D-alanyl-D-alanine-endopeptidase (penicillin-binding protein 4)